MSVASSDMKLKFSVAAAAGNTTAGTGATALGDQVSTTELTSGAVGNLFDDTTAAEATAGRTEYRSIFVCNDHATDTAFNVTVAIQSEVALGANYDVALGGVGVTARGSATAQAVTIANETTAPSGTGSFGDGPLTIGTIPPLSVVDVWVRKTVTAGTAAISNDGATIRIAGEG